MTPAAQGTSLARYDAACRAIAEARSIDEVKDIRDTAIAMAAYAKQAKNRGLEADAVEIRCALRGVSTRCGKSKRQRSDWRRGGGGKHGRKRVAGKPTLKEAGIDKNLAHEGRKLGALSEQEFEQKVAEVRDAAQTRPRHHVRRPRRREDEAA